MLGHSRGFRGSVFLRIAQHSLPGYLPAIKRGTACLSVRPPLRRPSAEHGNGCSPCRPREIGSSASARFPSTPGPRGRTSDNRRCAVFVETLSHGPLSAALPARFRSSPVRSSDRYPDACRIFHRKFGCANTGAKNFIALDKNIFCLIFRVLILSREFVHIMKSIAAWEAICQTGHVYDPLLHC